MRGFVQIIAGYLLNYRALTRSIWCWRACDSSTTNGVQTRYIGADTGWGSAIHPRAWFGLGVSDEIISLMIDWPSGLTQRAEVDADFTGMLIVVEG